MTAASVGSSNLVWEIAPKVYSRKAWKEYMHGPPASVLEKLCTHKTTQAEELEATTAEERSYVAAYCTVASDTKLEM